jgi:hypothetical protein
LILNKERAGSIRQLWREHIFSRIYRASFADRAAQRLSLAKTRGDWRDKHSTSQPRRNADPLPHRPPVRQRVLIFEATAHFCDCAPRHVGSYAETYKL